jgi:hypothetical protein
MAGIASGAQEHMSKPIAAGLRVLASIPNIAPPDSQVFRHLAAWQEKLPPQPHGHPHSPRRISSCGEPLHKPLGLQTCFEFMESGLKSVEEKFEKTQREQSSRGLLISCLVSKRISSWDTSYSRVCSKRMHLVSERKVTLWTI